MTALRRLEGMGYICARPMSNVLRGLHLTTPLPASQGSLLLQSVDGLVGFFRVADDDKEGKHSNNRSAYTNPIRLTASWSK